MTLKPRLHLLSNLAWALFALLIITSLLCGYQAQRLADSIVADNWRGRYDILVTAPKAEQKLSPGQDLGGLPLLDPNFANTAAPTISLKQVQQLRELAGTDVVAPVGYVGAMSDTMYWPMIFVPWEELTQPVTKLRIATQVNGTDGLSERLAHYDIQEITIDLSSWNKSYGAAKNVGLKITSQVLQLGSHAEGLLDKGVNLASFTNESEGGATDYGVAFTLFPLPDVRSGIFAVDPVAEQKLLGDQGQFLAPLARFDDLVEQEGAITADRVAKNATFTDRDELQLNPQDGLHTALAKFPGAQRGQRAALYGAYGDDSPFVGFLRNEQAYPPTQLTASIQKETATGYENVGSTSLDVGKAIRPFNNSSHVLQWPRGKKHNSDDEIYMVWQNYSGRAVEQLQLTSTTKEAPDQQRPAFQTQPQGFDYAVPVLPFFTRDGQALGMEQTYRKDRPITLTVGTRKDTGAAPFEVGSYTPTSFDSGSSYVPLGAYDAAAVTRASDAKVLEPTRRGLGLAAQPAATIVSLRGAQELTDQDFVTAVRIRVAGLEGLSRLEASQKIDALAGRIRTLGLDAYNVAGASLQEVQLWVPDYAFGTMDVNGRQTVADLGWVNQNFITLGAATWSEATVSQTLGALSLIGLALAAAALITVSILRRPENLTTQALLYQLGWSRWQRLRWGIGELWPSLVVTVIAFLVAIRWATTTQLRLGLLVAAGTTACAFLIAHPFTATKAPPALRLATRGQQLFLGFVEGSAVGLGATVLGIAGVTYSWFVAVSGRTRLSQQLLDALMPFGLVAGGVVVVLLLVQLITIQSSNPLHDRLATFYYRDLAVSRRKVLTRRICYVGAMLTVAILPVLAVQYQLASAGLPLVLGISVAAAWVALWLLFRVAWAVLWRPAATASTTKQLYKTTGEILELSS